MSYNSYIFTEGTLQAVSIPIVAMAAINFYVAIYYIILYFKKPQAIENIYFSCLCFAVGIYDILCICLYNSISIEQGVFWQRIQGYSIPVMSIFLALFINTFTEQKNNRVIKMYIIWILILEVISFFISPELFVSSSIPAIKDIYLLNTFKITYYEGATGIVFNIELISYALLSIYLGFISIRYYLRSRNKAFLPVVISIIIYLVSTLNDSLVAIQAYSFIYMSEYGYSLIIMAMSYALLSRFIAVQKAYEDLNDKLENKVEERTKENEKLQDKLYQSEKMAAIGQLAGGVAHEINNPMTVIYGYTQLILKKVKPDDVLFKSLQAIEKESARCKRLIENLLTFARSTKMFKKPMNINNVIKSTMAIIEARAKTKNAEITAIYGDNLPAVMIDANQIQQIMVNLCNNAMDAMPDGGTVSITTSQEEKYIRFDVSDTGTGISEENKKRLFEPFFTTKEVGKGTGLGLSICYELVKKHDGEISVISEVGKGTTFTVRLPK